MRPEILLSALGIDIYRVNEVCVEQTTYKNTGFLGNVVVKSENAADEATK